MSRCDTWRKSDEGEIKKLTGFPFASSTWKFCWRWRCWASCFLTAAHSDTVSARQQMATTIRYIQEQCNRYNRIELASETKSLMRVMESVGHIARQMAADGEERAAFGVCADGLCLRADCDG